MLPEIGASELLVIAIVALIVVGPKDLPMLLRRLGQFMAKVRGMANDFRDSFDEMARQSELDDLRKEVEAMRRGQFADMSISDSSYRKTVSEIEHSMSDVGVQLAPPVDPYMPPAEAAEPAAKSAAAPKPKAARSAKPKSAAAGPASKATKARAPKAATAKAASAKAAPAKTRTKPRAKKNAE